MRGALVLTLAVGLFADVAPRCGKREPRVASAGESCGGPFVCAAPSVCVTLDTSIDMPNYSSVYVCTKPCAADADCAGLGIAMQCTGKGRVKTGPRAASESASPPSRSSPMPARCS